VETEWPATRAEQAGYARRFIPPEANRGTSAFAISDNTIL